MGYKRILTIQDISCVGQCSMTVALPILSACGHEVCILPTAMLSTHTGGFGKPQVLHFETHLPAMVEHWKQNGITFDAILVGYLGSLGAVEAAGEILRTMLAPGGISIVDPAMADHGKLYSGLTEEYAQAMMALCRKADIILPNVTEAAWMAGETKFQDVNECYVNRVLCNLKHPRVVLTGGVSREGETGSAIFDQGKISYYSHPKLPGSYHGTGDMFAAAFTGALLSGKTLQQAVEIASIFLMEAISRTVQAPAHWYGVKFEEALPVLWRLLGK